MITREEFMDVIRPMIAQFGKPTADKLDVDYEYFSQRYDAETLRMAVSRWLETGRYYPKIAELREIIAGTASERASYAWYHYLECLKVIGPQKTADFQDRIAHKVCLELALWGMDIQEQGYPDQRRVGEYQTFCNCKDQPDFGKYGHRTDCQSGTHTKFEDKTDFIRAEFVKRYAFHLQHSDPRTLPDRLRGSNEIEYRKNFELYSESWTETIRENARHTLQEMQTPLTLHAAKEKQIALQAARKMIETGRKELTAGTKPTEEEQKKFQKALTSFLEKAGEPKQMTDEEVAERKRELEQQKAALLQSVAK